MRASESGDSTAPYGFDLPAVTGRIELAAYPRPGSNGQTPDNDAGAMKLGRLDQPAMKQLIRSRPYGTHEMAHVRSTTSPCIFKIRWSSTDTG